MAVGRFEGPAALNAIKPRTKAPMNLYKNGGRIFGMVRSAPLLRADHEVFVEQHIVQYERLGARGKGYDTGQ